jgi:cellulose synthase/poly-beta-1,6-N-acetylglucosamine synthase-like glycosyltransferase
MCGATTTLLYGANLVLDPVSEDATPDPESDVKGMVKVAAPYHVRVMVPTYSEPLDIVAKTCAAAATAWLPRGCRVTVYLCDDGKDRKKRNWCFKGDGRAHGVVYVSGRTRASGEMNGKSANLNNCMRHLYPDGKPVPPNEIVAVFDADQVANPDFFLKTLYKLDAGDDVAMVLSPQAFYNTRLNADIFNHSNIHFWEYAQHGYDALGFISCTGTNFLCRAAAYKDAGWSPEYTLTEDFALGMELKKKKWECRCVGRASERGRARGWRPRARSDT